MSAIGSLPASLRIVAAVFIVYGLAASIDMVLAFTGGRIWINLGVLGLLIGPGLLRLSKGWRLVALVFVWTGLAAAVAGMIWFLQAPTSPDVSFLGQPVGEVSPNVLVTAMALYLMINLWQLYILTRPDIRKLFLEDPKS